MARCIANARPAVSNPKTVARLVGLLFVTSGANTKIVVTRVLYETNTHKALLEEMKRYPGAYVGDVRMDREEGKNLVRAVVRGPTGFSAKDAGMIESKLRHGASGLDEVAGTR
ncbi:MAG: hypothetical protein L0Y39_12595 [Methylococcaceae bacterium]|nr:hypothetical protein [Methylococcaceae bacterium]